MDLLRLMEPRSVRRAAFTPPQGANGFEQFDWPACLRTLKRPEGRAPVKNHDGPPIIADFTAIIVD
jgi:hypothetical protein